MTDFDPLFVNLQIHMAFLGAFWAVKSLHPTRLGGSRHTLNTTDSRARSYHSLLLLLLPGRFSLVPNKPLQSPSRSGHLDSTHIKSWHGGRSRGWPGRRL
jgi:hypothetical protein